MAIAQQQDHSSSFLLDALYCEEDEWEEGGGGCVEGERMNGIGNVCSNSSHPCLLPLLLLERELFWEDEELLTLFSKEQQQQIQCVYNAESDASLCLARREAVEWILKVNAYYGFSTLSAVLSINYLDRFLSSLRFQRDKPWLMQLAAVTCLSLAAKVEETHVPLLLDLQVEGTKYLFEAKTIQKMELLVLSTLEWKMNPVTPLSFLDHIIRRLGLKTHLHWEFLRRCERLLLSVVSESSIVRYPPSVLATATMMHVISQIEPSNPLDYQKQLLDVLNMSKGKVDDCYQLIAKTSGAIINWEINSLKRKFYEEIQSSPIGVIDAFFSNESSNDSWTAGSSVSLSPVMPQMKKKSRVHEQPMPLPSLTRVFVDAGNGSPR